MKETVERLLISLGNVLSAGHTGEPLRDAYLKWVEETEHMLGRHVTSEWIDGLHTQRYWKIREIDASTPRPSPLISAEIARQHGRLSALLEGVSNTPSVVAPAQNGETVVVADTNVHLHFPSFDQIDWRSVTSASSVLLAVPLVVMEELDKHKNRGGPLGDRAQTVAQQLFMKLAGAGSSAVEVRDDVRVCLLGDLHGVVRTGNNDEDILNRVRAHIDAGGAPVIIVTGDRSMELRAQGRGFTTAAMPPELRLPSPDPAERRVALLERELRREQAKAPNVRITFAEGGSFLDPDPLVEPAERIDIEVEMAKAGEETPPMATPTGRFASLAGFAVGDVTAYNTARDAYLAELREWLVDGIRRVELHAGSVRLDLVALNTGPATAEDVEITISVTTPNLGFAVEEEFDPDEPPAEPRRPDSYLLQSLAPDYLYPSHAGAADDPETWTISDDGMTATIRLVQVRHGGSPLPLEAIFVVGTAGPVIGGAHLEWTITGVRPPVEFSGTLDVRPRRETRPPG